MTSSSVRSTAKTVIDLRLPLNYFLLLYTVTAISILDKLKILPLFPTQICSASAHNPEARTKRG
jgi:hypothetical protein